MALAAHSAFRFLLPLAAAGLIGVSGAALAQSSGPTTATPAPSAQNAPAGGSGEQTLQNNSATRALDRAAGTNTSGAYPGQSDGMPGNPPGTAATRALDRAAGTNTSGAYPQNEGNTTTPPATGRGSGTDAAPATPGMAAPGQGGGIGGSTPSR
jgi:hypothetical protein